jgi:hypothetical protein
MNLPQEFIPYRVGLRYPGRIISQEATSVATWNSEGFEIRYQVSNPTPNEIGAFRLGKIELGLCQLNDLSWICWRAAKVRLVSNLSKINLPTSHREVWDISWQECPLSLQAVPGEYRPVLRHYMETPDSRIAVTAVLIDLADKNRISALRYYTMSPHLSQWLVRREWQRLEQENRISQEIYDVRVDKTLEHYDMGRIAQNSSVNGFLCQVER